MSSQPPDQPADGAAPAPSNSSTPAARTGARKADWALALALAATAFLLYVPSLFNPFVEYDDPHYVTRNAMVRRGLTAEGIKWAFTTTTFGNWLPVAWLSHELDVQLFGLSPAGHHATSAAVHAANAALVFLALRSLTGARWRSAAVAAVFAVHPLRVESVVWIAERKDVLCATFFLLGLLAYSAYCRRPTAARYGLVLSLFALGLMSKTMLVTMPCLLLLLDFWPLRRLAIGRVVRSETPADGGDAEASAPAPAATCSIGRLVLEKLPLVALSVISCAWTVALQSQVGAMWGGRDFTLAQRLGNAVVAVPRYLGLTLWPTNLSIFYPHPGTWPAWQVAAAGALVLLMTVVAVVMLRRRSYVAVGWFWFLGMLVPVVGLVQVGLQSIADRYTYLPGMGLLVAGVWGTADLLRRRPQWRRPVGCAGALALLVLSVGTVRQQRIWSSTNALFAHALAVDDNNWLAHDMVAMSLDAAGQDAAAIEHYQRSIALNPGHADAYHNYGRLLHRLGRVDEALDLYRAAVRIQPDHPMTHFNLGVALASKKQLDDACAEFKLASQFDPQNPMVFVAWGTALMGKGNADESAARFADALRLDPYNRFAQDGYVRAVAAAGGGAPVAITQ